MFHAILLTTIILEIGFIASQDISPLVDIKTLSELPLEKLLKVKSTFDEENEKLIEKTMETETQSKSNSPEALALRSKPHDRGGYYHSYEEMSKKGGKKHIQSIFQTSVTTLAFLAFGGYLLCLLVQAIRGKSMPVTTMSPEIMAVIANLKRKPIRRKPVKLQRPKPYRNKRPKREIWPETDVDSMYFAFVRLSEAYANYHTINYKNLNTSFNDFYW